MRDFWVGPESCLGPTFRAHLGDRLQPNRMFVGPIGVTEPTRRYRHGAPGRSAARIAHLVHHLVYKVGLRSPRVFTIIPFHQPTMTTVEDRRDMVTRAPAGDLRDTEVSESKIVDEQVETANSIDSGFIETKYAGQSYFATDSVRH